jgi:uncharacterized protein (DUF58 family)
MRFRLFAILILVLLLNVVLASSPSAIQSQPPVSLVCLSPPERLELPVGQGVEILCHLQGTVRGARVVFRVNGVPQQVEDVPTDGTVTFAWRPTQSGPHTLAIAATGGGHGVAVVARQILVTSAGSLVRIP